MYKVKAKGTELALEVFTPKRKRRLYVIWPQKGRRVFTKSCQRKFPEVING